jgi:ribosomal protein L11 methyltransferase
VLRLAIRVSRAQSELVLAELLELVPAGVEELEVDANTVEYAVYGAPGELPELPALRAAARDALVDVSTTEVADDWAERWREFHRPLVLGDRLTVRPPWEPPGVTPIDIVIDPGRAFGTGAHATTRLCLELLLELPPPGVGGGSSPPATGDGHWGVVDLGCGSGVLALAAAALGWQPVLALDSDPLSVEATIENARVNSASIEVRRHDLLKANTPAGDLTLANLLASLHAGWISRLRAAPEMIPDLVIASGLLEAEADATAATFATVGLRERERRSADGWTALLLER